MISKLACSYKEFSRRVELPLVRLSSFSALLEAQLQSPVTFTALANDIHFTEHSGSRLLCFLCEAETDLHELFERASLASSSHQDSTQAPSFAQAAHMVEAAQTAMHNTGCPRSRDASVAQANNHAGMLYSSSNRMTLYSLLR